MDIFSTGLTSSALLSAVSANVQDTLASLAPVIELVIGVVLAFVLARYLISLFSATGTTGTTTEKPYNAYGSNNSRYLSQEEITAQFPLMHD